MTEPGWYHGDGDPEGTVRYWTGQAWAGEPTTTPSGPGQIYYAAPADDALAGMTTVATAVRYATAPPAQTPPIEAPTASLRTGQMPSSAQITAIVVSGLKLIPLGMLAFNTILITLFGSIGLQISYNEDFDTLLELTIIYSILFLAVGVGLLMLQALGAARNSAALVLGPALVMTGLDALLTLGAWLNDHSTDQFFYTGLFLAQLWVLIGAIIGLARRS